MFPMFCSSIFLFWNLLWILLFGWDFFFFQFVVYSVFLLFLFPLWVGFNNTIIQILLCIHQAPMTVLWQNNIFCIPKTSSSISVMIFSTPWSKQQTLSLSSLSDSFPSLLLILQIKAKVNLSPVPPIGPHILTLHCTSSHSSSLFGMPHFPFTL